MALEGLIGVGKSTFGKKISEPQSEHHPKMHFLAERVNPRLLACFYSDPKRYAFAFQMSMVRTRTWEYETIRMKHRNFQSYLMDRSAIGDVIFCLANAITGSIQQDELDAYLYELGTNIEQFSARGLAALDETWLPNIVYYLYDSVSACQRRVAIRANECESQIPDDYMRLLDILHFNLLLLQSSSLNFNVIPLVWDQYSGNVPSSLLSSYRSAPLINVVDEVTENIDAVLDPRMMEDAFVANDISVAVKSLTDIRTVVIHPGAEITLDNASCMSIVPIKWYSDAVRWTVAQLAAKLSSTSRIFIVSQ